MNCYDEMWELLGKHFFQIHYDVTSDLTCIICQNLLIDAWEGTCGCMYCKKCIEKYLSKGHQTCPKGDEGCSANCRDLQFKIKRNNMTNIRISQLDTQCPLNDCEYKGSLHEICDHIKICDKRLESEGNAKRKTENVTLDETASYLLNALRNHISVNEKWIKHATKYINSCDLRILELSPLNTISSLEDITTFTSANSFQSGQTVNEETLRIFYSDIGTIRRKSDKIVSEIFDWTEEFLKSFLKENISEKNEVLEISIEIVNEFPDCEENPGGKIDENRKTIKNQTNHIKQLTREKELTNVIRWEKEKQDREIYELKISKENILKERNKLEKELRKQRKYLSRSNQENEKLKKEIKELQQTEKRWHKKWIPMTPVTDLEERSSELVVERTIGLFVCHFNRISRIDTKTGSDKFYFTNRFIDVWIRLWPNGCKLTHYHQRERKHLCLDFLIDDGIIRHDENDRRHPRTYEVKIVLKSNGTNGNDKTVSESQIFEFDGSKSYARIFSPTQFHFLKADISDNGIFGKDDSLLVECQIDLTNQ